MDGHSVLVTHLVKLINAHHTTVSQHHGTRLQPLLTCEKVGLVVGW